MARRSKVVAMAVTPWEHTYITEEARRRKTTRAEVVRQCVDKVLFEGQRDKALKRLVEKARAREKGR